MALPVAGQREIVEYVAGSGRRPVADFYKGLKNDGDRSDFIAVVKALGEFGYILQMPHSKPLGEKLFELRQGRMRIFYVFVGRHKAMLLHAYLKQGQKTPGDELKTARQRAREVLA